ncbi:MAG: hypothetical protein ACI9OJ_001519, partial [Myxococcota bacterium]
SLAAEVGYISLPANAQAEAVATFKALAE